MLVVRVEHEDGRVVCERCAVADNPLTRMKGLLGRSELPPGEGLLLRPGTLIDTHFMRFPIDAVFVDDELRVLEVTATMKPWRIKSRRGARAVIELAAGECERRAVRPGDRLTAVDAA